MRKEFGMVMSRSKKGRKDEMDFYQGRASIRQISELRERVQGIIDKRLARKIRRR